ncbi:hypothetical protein BDZ94DRAFT_1170967, partial [Collybia nuda]
RGFRGPFTQGNWGLTVSQYLAMANGIVSVMIQIENQKLYRTLRRSRRWKESVSISISYLSGCMISINPELPTPSLDPHLEVDKVIQRILKVSHAAGKK